MLAYQEALLRQAGIAVQRSGGEGLIVECRVAAGSEPPAALFTALAVLGVAKAPSQTSVWQNCSRADLARLLALLK
eukprot:SAG11_NODE_10089_length_856_cov_1.215324_1_plen_75_part_10